MDLPSTWDAPAVNIRDTARKLISGHHLFGAMSRQEIDEIMTSLRVTQLAAEEILFSHDDPATHFYLVHEGRIKLSRIAPSGHEKVVNVIGEGACFAEAVMFMEQESYPVTAQALTAATVLGINCDTYKAILSSNYDAAFRLINDLSNRLQKMLNEIETLSVQNATHRVAHYFLEQIGSQDERVATVELDTSKSLLASRLSVEPETLSRIFAKLTSSGAIEVKGRLITVKDRGILREFA